MARSPSARIAGRVDEGLEVDPLGRKMVLEKDRLAFLPLLAGHQRRDQGRRGWLDETSDLAERGDLVGAIEAGVPFPEDQIDRGLRVCEGKRPNRDGWRRRLSFWRLAAALGPAAMVSMTLLSAAVTLLLILDPFGNIALFNSILRKIPAHRRRQILIREIAFAYLLLILFLLVGGQLLGFLGLQQSSLSIAGGIMLFMIAIGMVFPKTGVNFSSESGDEEPFIVPLATPLIAGPSGMAFLLLLASQHPGRLGEWTLAVTAASAASAAILIMGDRLLDLLGSRGMRAVERLMGMILTLIAVQMILNGVSLYMDNLHPAGY